MNITSSKDSKSSATVPEQPGVGRRSAAAVSASSLLSTRRVNAPKAVIGGLGVVACSMGTVAASHVLDPRTSVLVMARPVAAGEVITAADVHTVPVAVGGGIDAIPATQAADVVGRPAALPLAAGALLGGAAVGPSLFPPAGKAVAAVGLKPGMYPLHLAAGDKVQVVLPTQPTPVTPPKPGSSPASPVTDPLVATVTAVSKADSQGVTVANLLLDADGAAKVAAASTSMPGVAVTLLPAGDS